MSGDVGDGPRRVEVRLYGDLAWFVDGADRDGRIAVPVGRRRSVKDLVESLGVPHVEIGRLVVDDRSVTLDEVITIPRRVAVYPAGGELDDPRLRPPLPRPARFVLDVHLGTLARRLRTLGFDSVWHRDADDEELAAVAVVDRRVLLTRDRGLLMRSSVVHGQCPRSDDPDRQVHEVVERWGLRDELDPFTRCVHCNGGLVAVDREQVLDELPPRTRVEQDEFVRCTDCGQIYWPGSHHAAMSSFVARFR